MLGILSRLQGVSLTIGRDGCVVVPTWRQEQLEEAEAAASDLNEDTCCSYDEWRQAGYFVVRGSKSHFKDVQGVPQFTQEQVRKGR